MSGRTGNRILVPDREAIRCVGEMTIMFAAEPETFAVFWAWLCKRRPEFAEYDQRQIREDLLNVARLL